MSPLEKNGRQLIGVMVRCFPLGGTTEELRREFEKATSLRRQSFYETLRYCKQQGWLTGGGSPTRHGVFYQLDPAGSWKPPSAGESAGEPPLSRDQLEFLADSQAQQLAELRDQIEYLRDWSSGNANGVAVSNLAQIVSSSTATTRQRLRAAGAILGYKVQDAGVTEFTRRFLESLCASADIATDHRIEAGELLRKYEDARIVPPIERPAARTDNVDPAEPPPIPLPVLLEQRRAYCDQRTREIEIEMGLRPTVHISEADTPDRSGE